MRTNMANEPIDQSWANNRSWLKQIFTYLTGYDIMFEASREDLIPETMRDLRSTRKEKLKF